MTPKALAELHARANNRLRPWSAAEFASLLSDDHVFLNSVPQAFSLGRAVAGEAELLTIATDPMSRRQGHALACLEAFEDEAEKRGAERLLLEVDAENRAAIGLYHGAGYQIVATRPDYYRLRDGARADALIMAKPS